MQLTRRKVLGLTAGAAAFAVAGARISPALASAEDAEKRVMGLAGGATPAEGKITLTGPEIAENGNTVPVSVSVESAMEGDDLVESVIIFADGNPSPAVATFHFTELSGGRQF